MRYRYSSLLALWTTVLCGFAFSATVINVSQDGTADFATVQAAVDSIPAGNQEPVEIHLAPGIYAENVSVSEQRDFVSLIGESPETTVITSHSDSWDSNSIYQTLYWGSSNFSIEGVSIENTFTDGVGVAFFADGLRGQFRNVYFLGTQDTLKLKNGPFYFVDCRIEGAVDFVWAAGPMMAWFENCEIFNRSGGYIACQASDLSVPYGLVFNNCRLTRAASLADDTVYLARPWHDYGSITYLNCVMDSHIKPEGWLTSGNMTIRFNEYNSSGAGGDMSMRLVAPGVTCLTAQQAAEITLRAVVGAWSPTYASELWVNGTSDSWQVININGNSGNPPAGNAGDGVLGDGCSGSAVWNNLGGAGTAANLCDTLGNVTTASLVVPADQGAGAFDGGDAALQCPGDCGSVIMQEYLTNGNSGMKYMMLTGLKTGSRYDLYLYGHGDQEDQNTTFTVGGVSKTCYIAVAGLTSLTQNAHYVIFRDIAADSSGEILIQWGAESGWAAFNGMQVVQRDYTRPTGYASVEADGLATTTGGEGGDVVTVNNWTLLNYYCRSSKPYIILVDGVISAPSNGTYIDVQSNKTIVGLGSGGTIYQGELRLLYVNNIIIRNLTIRDSYVEGDYDGKTNDNDAVQADGCHHIWIDHCHFSHCGDGLIDLRIACDYITVSWTVLDDHNKAFGIGWTEETDFRTTIHHCWINNTNQRNPSFDMGIGHLYNNYISNITSYGNYARGQARLVIENSVFENVVTPVLVDSTAQCYTSGLQFTGCSGNNAGNVSNKPFDPHQAYDYTLDPTSRVPVIVRNQAGPQVYISQIYTGAEDNTPPSPDPMGWACMPLASGNTVSMEAVAAQDENGVEYYFANLTDSSHDSGWQESAAYTDSNLQYGTSYTYAVKARDTSANSNETGWSAEASATPEIPGAPRVLDVVNVNFQSGAGPVEDNGGAAFGADVQMYWNNYTNAQATISNCLNSAGEPTTVSITDNRNSAYYKAAHDLVYGVDIMDNYHWIVSETVDVEIAGLEAGAFYDLYIYGQGDQENQDSLFTIGDVSKSTGALAVTGLTSLTEGAHYVYFPGVAADANGKITIGWAPAAGSGYAAINGMQIISRLYGDFNRDCAVDSADLGLLAEAWLTQSLLSLSEAGMVTYGEFARLAADWLAEY